MKLNAVGSWFFTCLGITLLGLTILVLPADVLADAGSDCYSGCAGFSGSDFTNCVNNCCQYKCGSDTTCFNNCAAEACSLAPSGLAGCCQTLCGTDQNCLAKCNAGVDFGCLFLCGCPAFGKCICRTSVFIYYNCLGNGCVCNDYKIACGGCY